MIRRSPEEKREIIHIVEHSEMSVTQTLKELDVPRSSFYRWYRGYLEEGEETDRQAPPSPAILEPHSGPSSKAGSGSGLGKPGPVIPPVGLAFY